MNTGENAEALRKITDFLRMGSILLLGLHFYIYCYSAFEEWHLTHKVVEDILRGLTGTGLFRQFYISKLAALALLIVSLLGAKGKKEDQLKVAAPLRNLAFGLLLYGLSHYLLRPSASIQVLAGAYMSVSSLGFLLVMFGGNQLSRIIKNRLQKDIFNKMQETFPQEERYLQNEYSVNLPARYRLKDKLRKSYISIVNPFRGLLVLGTPGSRCGSGRENI